MGDTVSVRFLLADGGVVAGEGAVGTTLMRVAQHLDVRGIVAECGGMAACSTCHCYVAEEWLDVLPPRDRMERGMLRLAVDPDERSRLSCQLRLTPELDGLTVSVPARQA